LADWASFTFLRGDTMSPSFTSRRHLNYIQTLQCFVLGYLGHIQRSQAIAEYDKIPDQDKAVAAENQFVASGRGWVYAVSGKRTDALKIAQEFRDLSSHSYVDFYLSAGIYAGLNEKDEAFRLLEKGYEQHAATMPYLGIDVFWDGMRSDPRYADLLRRMGLPQPAE
jgi:tetratricopeptide (TPR) repeat protein